MLSSTMIRPCLHIALVFGAAFAIACGGDVDESVVARVDDASITATDVASYMERSGYPATLEGVERAVDELVDIHLVAHRARARHELTPSETLQIKEWRETALLNQFREDVVWESVTVDEAELREWYDQNVGEEVSARHVLIEAPATAPDSVRQAARALADSLFALVQGGADFAALAEAHSDDTGSAARGGSLGYFSRGSMVAPFEEAAFGTPVGEVVPRIVETRFGYHIIKVDDRRKRSFDELREEIEENLAVPGRQQAEQAYIMTLMERSGLEFYEDNIDSLIGMIDASAEQAAPGGAAGPAAPSDDERELNLATYEGGEVSMGEIWDLFEALPPANRQQITALDQTNMIRALSSVVQREIMLARADSAGIEADSVRQAQFEELVRGLYAQVYVDQALQRRLEIADSTVRQYYDEHREFYRDQSYEQVREQIRTILMTQRRQELSDPEIQRGIVSTIADSQASSVSVERYPEHYEGVLVILREQGDLPRTAAAGR